jgi:two-component system, response regulator PdtaR
MAKRSCLVLVVDDELLVRSLIADFVLEAGYRALGAANANEALAHLATNEIDLIISDVEMSGGRDGVDLARIVRVSWPTVPIILMSGQRLPRPDDLPNNVRFLAKPFGFESLQLALAEALNC